MGDATFLRLTHGPRCRSVRRRQPAARVSRGADPRPGALPHTGRGSSVAAKSWGQEVTPAAGAAEVVLFADVANPTGNSVYQRIGYLPVIDFTTFDFADGAKGSGG